jgi:hypothetical protein
VPERAQPEELQRATAQKHVSAEQQEAALAPSESQRARLLLGRRGGPQAARE